MGLRGQGDEAGREGTLQHAHVIGQQSILSESKESPDRRLGASRGCTDGGLVLRPSRSDSSTRTLSFSKRASAEAADWGP
jgi:hypothetical protein